MDLQRAGAAHADSRHEFVVSEERPILDHPRIRLVIAKPAVPAPRLEGQDTLLARLHRPIGKKVTVGINDSRPAAEIRDAFPLPLNSVLMPNDIAGRIHAILRTHNHRVLLTSDVALGAGGLNLDSIALVEVMLECEEAFGVILEPEVLTAAPLTVGSLIEILRARVKE